MLNNYLHVRSTRNGFGVFTSVKILKDMPILEFTGDIIPKDKLNIDPSQYIQIGLDNYIGPSGAIDDKINHSCNPNCYVHTVGNRAILYSLYVINPDNELTFDYSTTSTDTLADWKMKCDCGSYNCRKIISGYQYLDDSLKKEYESKGMVPLFITNPSFFTRKW